MRRPVGVKTLLFFLSVDPNLFTEPRIQNIPQLLAQSLGDLSIHLLRATFLQSLAVGFREPSYRIH
jgi:hypothetical protein